MAKTCPFSEISRCRNETKTSHFRNPEETKTLKNSVSSLPRDTTALVITIINIFTFYKLLNINKLYSSNIFVAI